MNTKILYTIVSKSIPTLEQIANFKVYTNTVDLYRDLCKTYNKDHGVNIVPADLYSKPIRNGNGIIGWNNMYSVYITNTEEYLGSYSTDWDFNYIDDYLRGVPGAPFLEWRYKITGYRKDIDDWVRQYFPQEDVGCYMCDKCYSTFEYRTYSDIKPCCGNIVQIDRYILNEVAELNKKGYKTMMSCSGHMSEYHNKHVWISFGYTELKNRGVDVLEFINSATDYPSLYFTNDETPVQLRLDATTNEELQKYFLQSDVIFLNSLPFSTEEERKERYHEVHKWAWSLKSYTKYLSIEEK